MVVFHVKEIIKTHTARLDFVDIIKPTFLRNAVATNRQRRVIASILNISLTVWGGISHLNGFEIFILFYIMTVSVKFQMEIRFSIELHGNSKLSMTSCPPSDSSLRSRANVYNHV